MSWYQQLLSENNGSDADVTEDDILCSAIVLNDSIYGSKLGSSEKLLYHVRNDIPANWKIVPHYITLNKGSIKNRDIIGEEICVSFFSVGFNNEIVVAKAITNADGEEDDDCEKTIVIACREEKENLIVNEKDLEWKIISGFSIFGYIGEVTHNNEFRVE